MNLCALFRSLLVSAAVFTTVLAAVDLEKALDNAAAANTKSAFDETPLLRKASIDGFADSLADSAPAHTASLIEKASLRIKSPTNDWGNYAVANVANDSSKALAIHGGSIKRGLTSEENVSATTDVKNAPVVRKATRRTSSNEARDLKDGGSRRLVWDSFDFSDPCDCIPGKVGSCTPPDGAVYEQRSVFVGYCYDAEKGINGEVFGSCDNGNGGKDCCDGNGACSNLNAWVKKGTVDVDGVDTRSCIGDWACQYAHIPLIDGSCIEKMACIGAGEESVVVGQFISSCVGEHSCWDAGKYGMLGDLTASCIGQEACRFLGKNGEVGNVDQSCREVEGGVDGSAPEACKEAGNGGQIGDIENSCRGQYACRFVAKSTGNIGTISNSCVGDEVCDSYCNGPALAETECNTGLDWINNVVAHAVAEQQLHCAYGEL